MIAGFYSQLNKHLLFLASTLLPKFWYNSNGPYNTPETEEIKSTNPE